MRRASLFTALVGLALSAGLSVLAWVYFDSLLLFLFVPFVPFLFRRVRTDDEPRTRRCPACGFESDERGFEYCPHDGTRLEPDRGR